MMDNTELLEFANKHSLILEKEGECGFGRPCVGFLTKGSNYLDHNPTNYKDYSYINGEYDERLDAPSGVEAYHKHDCMAVLVHDDEYEEGLAQLLKWVKHLESQGELEVVEYKNGAEGMQIVVSGATGYAIKFK